MRAIHILLYARTHSNGPLAQVVSGANLPPENILGMTTVPGVVKNCPERHLCLHLKYNEEVPI